MKVTGWLLPTESVNGELGEELTPVGSPLIETVTLPVKPFTGVAVTVTAALVEVCATSNELGEGARVKPGVLRGVDVPPHPFSTKRKRAANWRSRRERRRGMAASQSIALEQKKLTTEPATATQGGGNRRAVGEAP